ncbi:hypothetical protein D3C80_2045510 [compost metagenome]
MFRINLLDDLVQFYSFVFPEHLFQRQLKAIVGEHMHISLAAQHLAVYQRAVAIKQNAVNLIHQGKRPSVKRR